MFAMRRSVGVWAGCALLFCGAGASGQVMVSYAGTGRSLLMQNAPFQCERVTTTSMRLQDGGMITRQEHEQIGRDADGRVFDESFLKADADGTLHHFYVVADPAAKRERSWNDLSKSGQIFFITATTHLDLVPLPPDRGEQVYFPKNEISVKTEDLGAKTISGLRATGTRTTTTLPAGAMGNDKPLTKTQEVWVADDLQLVVEETDTSSVIGSRTVKLISVERTAPAASRFEVPSDITFKSMFAGGMFGAAPPR